MKRPLLIFGIVVGALLMLGPLVGMFGTVFGMRRAFDTLEGSGLKDPERLSADIGVVLYSTFAGMAVFPIGLLTVAACTVFLIRDHRKTPPPLPPGSVATDNPPPFPK